MHHRNRHTKQSILVNSQRHCKNEYRSECSRLPQRVTITHYAYTCNRNTLLGRRESTIHEGEKPSAAKAWQALLTRGLVAVWFKVQAARGKTLKEGTNKPEPHEEERERVIENGKWARGKSGNYYAGNYTERGERDGEWNPPRFASSRHEEARPETKTRERVPTCRAAGIRGITYTPLAESFFHASVSDSTVSPTHFARILRTPD